MSQGIVFPEFELRRKDLYYLLECFTDIYPLEASLGPARVSWKVVVSGCVELEILVSLLTCLTVFLCCDVAWISPIVPWQSKLLKVKLLKGSFLQFLNSAPWDLCLVIKYYRLKKNMNDKKFPKLTFFFFRRVPSCSAIRCDVQARFVCADDDQDSNWKSEHLCKLSVDPTTQMLHHILKRLLTKVKNWCLKFGSSHQWNGWSCLTFFSLSSLILIFSD